MRESSDEHDWRWVRKLFDLDPTLVFLDAMLVASHPRPVRRAIRKYRRRLEENPSEYLSAETRALRLFDRSTIAAAGYLKLENPATAGPELIALTDSTTMGLGLIYGGLLLADGDEFLIPRPGQFFTEESINLRLQTGNGSIRGFDLFADSATASPREMLANVKANVKDQTRILGLTWVLSESGVKVPLRAIGEAVEEINRTRDPARRILIVVDGVHGFGVEDLSFDQMECDFFISGCHKWIFGPRGTGIICGRRQAWDLVAPTIIGLRGTSTPGRLHSPGGVLAFEHRWAVTEAFDLHLSIGKRAIQDRTQKLARLLKDGLRTIPGVHLKTPRSSGASSGIVCCKLDSMKASDAVKQLKWNHRIIASSTSGDLLRFSPSIINSVTEIERSVDGVRSVVSR